MMRFGVYLDDSDLPRLEGYRRDALQALYEAVRLGAIEIVHRIMFGKLSGEVLNVRTGNLRRSFQENIRLPEISGTTVRQVFGTNLAYGAHWEFGGTIPAHRVEARFASALHFQVGGQSVFARYADIPARADAARPYVRPSIEEEQGAFNQLIVDGQVRAAERWGLRLQPGS